MLYEARMGCQDAMDHDLGISKALGILFAFVRHVNRLINDNHLDQEQADQILVFVRQVNEILDVIDFDDGPLDPQVKRIVDERDTARTAGDFARADALRAQLQSLGWTVTDSPTGTRVKKIEDERC
jgi:cysteinyl-tRNA synthetase